MRNSEQGRLVDKIRLFCPKVDRVADATKPVKIQVTSEDGVNAKKKSENACALAVACERNKVCDSALIWPRTAYLIHGNLAVRYRVPESVRMEIVSFDRHHDFRAGEYQLSAVSKCDRLGSGRLKKTGPKKKKRVTILPAVSHRIEGVRQMAKAK